MVKAFGEFLLFIQSMLTRKERLAVLWQRTLDECIIIGINSIFIVAIVSAFIGAVTCVQIAYNLTNPLIPKSTIGYMVREMTILELAPTITSIVLAMALSIIGGYLAGSLTGALSAQEYIEGIRTDFIPYNIVFALIKSVVFAFLVSAISSFKGFFTQGGALEVGNASTTAVNNSIIAILIADFVLAAVLL